MKNVINWSYERASWQWDILCLLILAFIFMAPKSWFESERKLATRSPAAVVQPDNAKSLP